MSTLNIDGASAFNSRVNSLGGTQGVRSAAKTGQDENPFAALQSTDSAGAASATDISKPAQLYSKLQQLQTSDPAKYKATLTDVAGKLRTAADKAGSTTDEGKFLSTLADKFDKAANGDLPPLNRRRVARRKAHRRRERVRRKRPRSTGSRTAPTTRCSTACPGRRVPPRRRAISIRASAPIPRRRWPPSSMNWTRRLRRTLRKRVRPLHRRPLRPLLKQPRGVSS